MVAVAISAFSDPVTQSNVASVVASGTTDVSTNTVAVLIVDALGASVGPVAATVVGTAWSIAATDVSVLADGVLIFEATATDLAAAKAFAAKASSKLTSPSFATVRDYEALTQQTVTPGSTLEAAVQFWLAASCEAIRSYTGQDLDFVAGDVVALDGTGRRGLILPQMPALVVNAVTIDKGLTSELVVTDFDLGFGGILRRTGFQDAPPSQWWCPRPVRSWPLGLKNVTVDYDHGYRLIPFELKMIAIQVARSNIAITPGFLSETIGGYSYTKAAKALSVDDYASILNGYRLPQVMVA